MQFHFENNPIASEALMQITFDEKQIIDIGSVMALKKIAHIDELTDTPILIDLHAIMGFDVEAFEMLISLLSTSTCPIALVVKWDQISSKYASLLALTVQNTHMRSFQSKDHARLWLMNQR